MKRRVHPNRSHAAPPTGIAMAAYWLVSTVIAFGGVKLSVWLLSVSGLTEDSERMLVGALAFPIAVTTIATFRPRGARN